MSMRYPTRSRCIAILVAVGAAGCSLIGDGPKVECDCAPAGTMAVTASHVAIARLDVSGNCASASCREPDDAGGCSAYIVDLWGSGACHITATSVDGRQMSGDAAIRVNGASSSCCGSPLAADPIAFDFPYLVWDAAAPAMRRERSDAPAGGARPPGIACRPDHRDRTSRSTSLPSIPRAATGNVKRKLVRSPSVPPWASAIPWPRRARAQRPRSDAPRRRSIETREDAVGILRRDPLAEVDHGHLDLIPVSRRLDEDGPALPEYLAAFERRFVKSCSMRCGLTST
jgi:hypothetical protein